MNTQDKIQQKNIPQGWFETSIEKECDVLKGQGLSKSKLSENGKNDCILYGELFTTYKEIIKEIKSHTDSTEGIRSILGDILIPASTTTTAKDLGIASSLNKDGVLLGGDINIIRKKRNSYDSNFLAYYLTHYKNKELSGFAQGITIVHLYGKDFKQLGICIPKDIKEQEKIAEILSSIDTDIEKTSKVIKSTEKIKKGLMQNLLNFKDEKNVKHLALGYIGKVSMCKRIFKEETSTSGDIPFYKIGTFGKEPDSFISQELFDNYRNKFSFPKIGDVLLSASGTIGRKVKYDGKPAYFQDSNIIWLEHDESIILNSFLFYLYDTIRWQTEGSTIKRLYNSILLRKIIPVPPIYKQQEVVEVLSMIDEKILINKKLKAKLIKLKKGLAEDLLSGKVRV